MIDRLEFDEQVTREVSAAIGPDDIKRFSEMAHEFRTKLGVTSSTKKALAANAVIDQIVSEGAKRAKNFNPKCKKGCGACCHKPVLISQSEAKLLADAIAGGLTSIDMNKLKAQAKFIKRTNSDDQSWVDQPKIDSKCIFLNEQNECSVYPARPSACRTYFVDSDPKVCDVQGDAKVSVYINPYTVMTSLALLIDETKGLLPQMLFKQLKKNDMV